MNLETNKNLNKPYPTFIIVYCHDTNSFFISKQRCFNYNYYKEFLTENESINYFKTHLLEFQNMRKSILNKIGGWDFKSDLFLDNTNKRCQLPLG